MYPTVFPEAALSRLLNNPTTQEIIHSIYEIIGYILYNIYGQPQTQLTEEQSKRIAELIPLLPSLIPIILTIKAELAAGTSTLRLLFTLYKLYGPEILAFLKALK